MTNVRKEWLDALLRKPGIELVGKGTVKEGFTPFSS